MNLIIRILITAILVLLIANFLPGVTVASFATSIVVAMVLGLMANNAIHGAEAGNGLKSILSSLVKPTKNGAQALKDLGAI